MKRRLCAYCGGQFIPRKKGVATCSASCRAVHALLGVLPCGARTITKSQTEIFSGARMYGAQWRPAGRYGSGRPFRS